MRARLAALAGLAVALLLGGAAAITQHTSADAVGKGYEIEFVHTRAAEQDEEVDFDSPEQTPLWLTDYIAFHKANRGQPGAKYVVATCNTWCCPCGGLGDRLRGILYILMIARIHKRVLLVAWESPGPLDTFLEPAEINWSLEGLGLDLTTSIILHGWGVAGDVVSFKPPDGGDDRIWMVHTTHFNGRVTPPDMPPFERVSYVTHLLMKALFRPSEELNRRTDQVQKEMFGSLNVSFVAVHLRMAHMDGEPGLQNRFGATPALHAVMAAWDCSRHMLRAIQQEESNATVATSALSPADRPNALSSGGPNPRRHRRALRQEDNDDDIRGGAALDSEHAQIVAGEADEERPRLGTGRPTLRRSRDDADGEHAAAAAAEEDEGGLAPWQQDPDDEEEEEAEGAESGEEAVGGRRARQPGPARCAEAAPRHRVAFITDHFELRNMVRQGMLGGVVGPLGEAHHIGDAKNKSNEAHWNTFVDLLLMARARCLIWADSGYPKTAIMWRWHECSRELPLCVSEAFRTQLDGRRRLTSGASFSQTL